MTRLIARFAQVGDRGDPRVAAEQADLRREVVAEAAQAVNGVVIALGVEGLREDPPGLGPRRGLGSVDQGREPAADEAAAGDRRQVVDLGEPAALGEALQQAEVEGRAAHTATRQGEAEQLHVLGAIAGPAWFGLGVGLGARIAACGPSVLDRVELGGKHGLEVEGVGRARRGRHPCTLPSSAMCRPAKLAPLVFASLVLGACDPGAPGTFPPEDPKLAAQNEAAGDPHRGRFPFEEAVAGLPQTGQLRATIVTDAGEVHCRLLADIAPLSVANFVGLARGVRPFLDPEVGDWVTRPFYDGLTFHRAIQRQFVQGGRLGEHKWVGFVLQDEFSVGTAFDKPGVLALANHGEPNTSAVEFFITTEVRRNLDGQYTIIGRCEDPLVVRELEAQTLAGAAPTIETIVITRE